MKRKIVPSLSYSKEFFEFYEKSIELLKISKLRLFFSKIKLKTIFNNKTVFYYFKLNVY